MLFFYDSEDCWIFLRRNTCICQICCPRVELSRTRQCGEILTRAIDGSRDRFEIHRVLLDVHAHFYIFILPRRIVILSSTSLLQLSQSNNWPPRTISIFRYPKGGKKVKSFVSISSNMQKVSLINNLFCFAEIKLEIIIKDRVKTGKGKEEEEEEEKRKYLL